MARRRTETNGSAVDDLPLIAGPSEWHERIRALSRDHLYSAVATGELQAIRRGRRILITRSALLSYLGEPQP
jgi:excisionase family DNA binding protein